MKGIPECLLAKWFLGGPGQQGHKTTRFQKTRWIVGLAAFRGKAQKPLYSGEYVVFGSWYRKPPKNNLAKNTLRDPFDVAALWMAMKL